MRMAIARHNRGCGALVTCLAAVVALALAGGCGDGAPRHEAPGAGASAPAAKLTLSNPVAATAQSQPPVGFPHSRRHCRECDLPDWDLSGARLAGSILIEANLAGANLSDANLVGAWLGKASLAEADLSGAGLAGASLVEANLAGADLRGAHLGRADLSRADLTRADLSEADLEYADLTGADLTGASLAGARLSGATWTDGELCANGSTGACASVAEVPMGRALAKAVMPPAATTDEFQLGGGEQPVFCGRVAKWFGGRRAAVSITYDSAYGTWPVHAITANMVTERGLRMDHEIVTSFYMYRQWSHLVPVLRDELIPRGIHLFGHGHWHVNHDSLSYGQALESFTWCYQKMEAWGLRPRAYSYPHSRGYEEETQRACRTAGFICARGSTIDLDEVLLCADEETEPDNWFYLPAASIAAHIQPYLKTHEELSPVLDQALEHTAWLVLMYHGIGQPLAWGYYPTEEFAKDLDQIAASDFWSANMDDAAVYVQERNAARIEVTTVRANGDLTLVLRDELDDRVYDHPLTVELDFNPDLDIGAVAVTRPGGETRTVQVEEGLLRLDVTPDSGELNLRLYPAALTGPAPD